MYTLEPDYFETQTEREMEQEFLNNIDALYKKEEKIKRQKIEKVKAILDTHNIQYSYNKCFEIYVHTVADFKMCKRLFVYGKSLPELGVTSQDLTYFSRLNKDSGLRFFRYRLF